MAKRRPLLTLCAVAGLATMLGVVPNGCDAKITAGAPVLPAFGDVIPLSVTDVTLILARAAASLNSPFLHAAVVDRTGDILGVYSTAGAVVQDEDNIAVSLARTTAFFSNSQAPLSSRTVETLSTFHFPPTFGAPFLASRVPVSLVPGGTVIAPQRTTTGVAGTPQGPLWQINSTNRGADIASALTVPPTAFNVGFEFNPSRNIDGSFPSPGITLLPGAVPLYKANSSGLPRLVGGVGVFVRQDANSDPDVQAAEFAAISGASGTGVPGDENFFLAIPPEGAIFLVGILLPYVQQLTRPAPFAAGSPPGPLPPDPFPDPNWLVLPVPGRPDPFGFLIGPRASPDGDLSEAEVRQIITQVEATANDTRAAIRLPLGSAAKVIATVVDRRGLILAHFRMEDTLTDAVDVVPNKARSAAYFSRPNGPELADQWPGFPVLATGVAVTTRTLGFLSQPFYPPGIDGTGPGPLFQLALDNQLPTQVDRLGNAAPDPGYQNGLTFFPGSVPLYRNGVLVGALGVSGDGVEQNDLIAAGGARGIEPPPAIRIDNFQFNGVRLPYLKFPSQPR